MSSEDFETESLTTDALEDLLRFWEELRAVANCRVEEIRQTLLQKYEREEVNYFFTEFGLIRGHEKGFYGTQANDR